MKHSFIIISILLLSSPVIGNSHKGEILYRWGTSSHFDPSPGYVWKRFREKDTNPKYKGDVKNGEPNGIGYIIFANGWKYHGEWENGAISGHGTLNTPNGPNYVGQWKNWKHHGQGTITFPTGVKIIGDWKDDKPWIAKIYGKRGNKIGIFVNGKSHKKQ